MRNHPGYFYLICDECGVKIKSTVAIKVQDKFNYFNGLIVCPKCYEHTNPQTFIKAIKEKDPSTPDLVRPESTDNFINITDPDNIESGEDSNLRGYCGTSPRNLELLNIESSYIELIWTPPLDPGSPQFNSFGIERNTNSGGWALIATTTNSDTYYKDTSISSGNTYQYRVYITCSFGTRLLTEDGDFLITEDGNYLSTEDSNENRTSNEITVIT
jgi:hypothetical protein